MLSFYNKLNATISLLSLILVPTLIVVCFFWLVQPITINTVTSNNSFITTSGATSKIYSPILINANSKLEYELILTNNSNQTIYVYPKYYSSNLSIDVVNIKIPDHIKPAVYKLIAVIKYRLNPIKQGLIKVELAQITIIEF